MNKTEVFKKVLEAYGFKTIPKTLTFQTSDYSTERIFQPDSLPAQADEDVMFEYKDPTTSEVSQKVAYKRHIYNPEQRVSSSGRPPVAQVVENFPVITIPLLYSFYVNDESNVVSFSIGAQPARTATNGRGGQRDVIMRVPAERQIKLAPKYVIPDVERNIDVAMAMLLHPFCEQSPLNWDLSMASKHGLNAHIISGATPLMSGALPIKFTCLTIKDKASVERATGSAALGAEYVTLLTEMLNNEPHMFRTMCESVGEVVQNAPNGLQLAFLNLISRSGDNAFIKNVFSSMKDKSLTALALANKAKAMQVMKETDAGWSYAIGNRGDIGARHGIDGLAERIEEDDTLRIRIEHLCRIKDVAVEVMEHTEADERIFMQIILESIQKGIETIDGTPVEGAVYLSNKSNNRNTHCWKDYAGKTVVSAGTSGDVDENKRVLIDFLMEKVRTSLKRGMDRDAVIKALHGWLGATTGR